MDIIGIGGPEFFVLLLLAAIVLGPERIVKVSRSLGKFVRQVQSLTGGLTEELTREIDMLNHEIQHGTPKDLAVPAKPGSEKNGSGRPLPKAYQKFREDFPEEGDIPAPTVPPAEEIP